MSRPDRYRVLFDTNILISYILSGQTRGTITKIVEAALLGRFGLLLTSGVITEFEAVVTEKPYLSSRITAAEAARFIGLLASAAEMIPSPTTGVLAIARDREDDYVLAAALLGQADYLVTGDRDLLSLVEVGRLKIVAPADFLEIIS